MAAEQKSRTSGSASTRSAVAPVRAETGFMVMLPQSLYQMSWRTSVDMMASNPAPASRLPASSARVELLPRGSPTMSPLPVTCRTTPGSGVVQLAWTTPPSTRPKSMAAAMVPFGSMLRSGSSPSSVPWPNHQGTPFINGSTTVPDPSSWVNRSATSARAGALTARMTRSCSPSSAARAAARTSDVTRPSAISSRQPLPRKDSSVAPRAMVLTSAAPRC